MHTLQKIHLRHVQVFICVGILVAYLVGLPYRDNIAQHAYIGSSDVAWWRVMLAFGLIPAALQVHSGISSDLCHTKDSALP